MPVRPFRTADRAQVAAWKRELWGDDAEEPDETVLVWEGGDGSLGGFVSLSLRPWAEGCTATPVPYVEGWYVAEGLRRRGIGRALMRAAEEWARSQDFGELGSDARLDNAVSLRAHRRLGFVPTERLQYFRKDLVAPAGAPVRVERHTGRRSELRPLFEMAEDSGAQLDAYLEAGDVLVARTEGRIVGHLQLVDDEIRNMAVAPAHRGRGIGRTLIERAVELARARRRSRLVVATAAADVDNLRFYQRAGFRMRSIERDAFTTAAGYPEQASADGIELRDRVWLDLELDAGRR